MSVDSDALAVLDAINDRAITRLAVPDREPSPVEHEWKEPAAARERIVSAFAYSPSGQVTVADWEIRGLDRRTEINPENVLDPERRYAAPASRRERRTLQRPSGYGACAPTNGVTKLCRGWRPRNVRGLRFATIVVWQRRPTVRSRSPKRCSCLCELARRAGDDPRSHL